MSTRHVNLILKHCVNSRAQISRSIDPTTAVLWNMFLRTRRILFTPESSRFCSASTSRFLQETYVMSRFIICRRITVLGYSRAVWKEMCVCSSRDSCTSLWGRQNWHEPDRAAASEEGSPKVFDNFFRCLPRSSVIYRSRCQIREVSPLVVERV